MIGLNYKHWNYFADMLIMANKYQLEAMATEVLRELRKRREQAVSGSDCLPYFKDVERCDR